MKILILGDVHGYWEDLNIVMAQAMRKHPDIEAFIQVGDLGYGWRASKPFKFLKTFWENADLDRAKSLPFHWLDGNHENHDKLDIDKGAFQPEMIYQGRGTTHDFGYPFGNAMFFGGASSIDKAHRIEGLSWWAQESIQYGQIQRALQYEGTPDIILSHEHPISFPYKSYKLEFGASDKRLLDELLNRYKPKFWVFGHHHEYRAGETFGTKWACAPCIETRNAILWDGDDLKLI